MGDDESNLLSITLLLKTIKDIQTSEETERTTGTSINIKRYYLTKVSHLKRLETLIFFSVLEGEFYLSKCQELLDDISEGISSIDISAGGEILESVTRLKIMLDDYSYLKEYVVDRSSNVFQKRIFNFEIERRLSIRKDSDYDFLWLFSVNVRLAEIDEGYAADPQTIALLVGFHHDLNMVITKRKLTNQVVVIGLLQLKCNLLLYKILKRVEKTDEIVINISNDKFSINDIEEDIQSNLMAGTIIDDIKKQYFSYEIDIDPVLEIAKAGNSKIADVHKIVKYFKKAILTKKETESAIVVLERLVQDFSKRLAKINKEDHKYISEANEIAYITTINLVDNAIFTLQSGGICDKAAKRYSAENLRSGYVNLKTKFQNRIKHESQHAPNFMLYRLYVNSLVKLIQTCDKKARKSFNDHDSGYEELLNEMFDDAFDNLQLFKDKIDRSRELDLMPLYLEIEQCNKYKFFLDSQYILPTNYNRLSSIYESLLKELRDLERIKYYIIPKNIKENLTEVFKKEVKDHQYSVITIIGLYASFITYVLANVSILPDLIKHSMGAVFAFMLVLGVVLFFFTGTLKLLFSTNKYYSIFGVRIYYFFLWLIAALLITIIALCKIEDYGNVGITKADSKTEDLKKDSFKLKGNGLQ